MVPSYPESPVCAVGAIIFEQDRVLLVRRGTEPSKGKWSIPGGRLHLGEKLEEAVIREVLEETHLHVQPVCVAKVVERIYSGRTIASNFTL